MDKNGLPDAEVTPAEENMEIPVAILCANLRRLYKYARKGPGSGFWFAGSMFRCFKVLSDMPFNRTTGRFFLEMIDKAQQLNAEFITPKTMFLGFSQIVNLAVGNLVTAFVSLLVAVRKKRKMRR